MSLLVFRLIIIQSACLINKINKMFSTEIQSTCCFFKLTTVPSESSKPKSTQNQPYSPKPRLKKSLSNKKKEFIKARQTSQKKTKTQSYDSKEADQKNKPATQNKNHQQQVFQCYYSGPHKNRTILKIHDEANNYLGQLNDQYYSSNMKRGEQQLNSKQVNFFYYPCDTSIAASTKVNSTTKRSMENIQPTLKTMSNQHSQPILKTMVFKHKEKQLKGQIANTSRNLVNLVNKGKQMAFQNLGQKQNPEKQNQILFTPLPSISIATQGQSNNHLQLPKQRKNSQSWQISSNATSQNAFSHNHVNSIFLRQKTVQSVGDEDSVLQQESFVERIHGPTEGQILSLFQL